MKAKISFQKDFLDLILFQGFQKKKQINKSLYPQMFLSFILEFLFVSFMQVHKLHANVICLDNELIYNILITNLI